MDQLARHARQQLPIGLALVTRIKKSYKSTHKTISILFVAFVAKLLTKRPVLVAATRDLHHVALYQNRILQA